MTKKVKTPGKNVIVTADPPWYYAPRKAGSKFGSGAGGKYPLMNDKDILRFFDAFGKTIKADNAAGFFWSTSSKTKLLFEGFDILEKKYGWRFATLAFNWVKMNKDGTPFKGTGAYTGKGCEMCWLIVKGSMPVAEKLVPETLFAERQEHSRKPEEAILRINRMFPIDPIANDHIELFCRQPTAGYRSFGNQLQAGKDIFEDLDGLF